MNLIQIQDDLKGLPTPTIMAYVNGSNPEVPPYMALSELDRRKRMEQRRAEPPTQSVKEKIESEIQQPQGISQLTQGPQGTPQAPPQGPPQGQPGMPQQMPPPGMAAGGIARIPTRSDMFRYAPGGIVAFAGEDESLVTEKTPEDFGAVRTPMGDIDPRYSYRTEANPFPQRHGSIPSDVMYGKDETGAHNPALDLPGAFESSNKGVQPSGIAALPETAELKDLVPNAAQRLKDTLLGKVDIPKVQTKEEIRNILIAEALADGNVEKAKMLSQIPGDSLIPLIKQLNEQNKEQRAGFKEGQGRMGLAALSNALIAAGEATRGHKGAGFFTGTGEAFGGFGKSYNTFTAEDVKRLEAQKAVERTQTIEVTTLQSKIDDLRAAYANGTIQDQQEAQKAIQDQAYKMQALKIGSAGTIITQALEQAKADTTKSHYGALEKNAAAQLDAQIARNKAAAGEAAARLQVSKEEQKERTDARARAALDDAMTKDARIQIIRDKLKDPVNPIPIGSDEYNKAMDQIEKYRRQIIREHPEFDVPDTSGIPQYAKDAKGNVIVSYDNFATYEPVKRPLTAGR